MYSHIIVLVQLIQLNAISFVYDGEQSFLAVVSERMKRAPDLSLKKKWMLAVGKIGGNFFGNLVLFWSNSG